MHLHPDHKLSGVLTPLFALRSEFDQGIGDIAALRDLIVWAASNHIGVVQLLPVNETGYDHSPYNAISSVALDPLTLEISSSTFPELSDGEIKAEVQSVFPKNKTNGPVNYDKVKPLKWKLLRLAFQNFNEQSLSRNDKRARAFRSWCKQQESWLPAFCLFRTLMDRYPSREKWDQWPADLQTFSSASTWLSKQTIQVRKEWELSMREIAYIQWNAWTQWENIKTFAESHNVALMGDVPFGVSYYSADVFENPELFDAQWSCGAPPEPAFQLDPFTARWGQNWGVPLYRWDKMAERQYHWWRQRVRKVREVFHLFRIDHVLGFFRVFAFPWRPEQNNDFTNLSETEAKERTNGHLPHFIPYSDDSQEHKDANRLHGETVLRILQEETGPYRLIAEDLGTVPDYVRPCLQSLQIAGFKVPIWEHNWDTSLIPGNSYEALSVATYATHDHEPLRALWDRWMQTIAAGESGRPEDAAARDWVWWEVRRLGRWANFEVPCILPFEDVHESLLRGLLASRSWLAISMITDFFGSSQRFNVPGSVGTSNWSERIELPVSKWASDPIFSSRMHRIAKDLQRQF